MYRANAVPGSAEAYWHGVVAKQNNEFTCGFCFGHPKLHADYSSREGIWGHFLEKHSDLVPATEEGRVKYRELYEISARQFALDKRSRITHKEYEELKSDGSVKSSAAGDDADDDIDLDSPIAALGLSRSDLITSMTVHSAAIKDDKFMHGFMSGKPINSSVSTYDTQDEVHPDSPSPSPIFGLGRSHDELSSVMQSYSDAFESDEPMRDEPVNGGGALYGGANDEIVLDELLYDHTSPSGLARSPHHPVFSDSGYDEFISPVDFESQPSKSQHKFKVKFGEDADDEPIHDSSKTSDPEPSQGHQSHPSAPESNGFPSHDSDSDADGTRGPHTLRNMTAAETAATMKSLWKKLTIPDATEKFGLLSDLKGYEKDRSRPWICLDPFCMYHEHGLPTEVELNRHIVKEHYAPHQGPIPADMDLEAPSGSHTGPLDPLINDNYFGPNPGGAVLLDSIPGFDVSYDDDLPSTQAKPLGEQGGERSSFPRSASDGRDIEVNYDYRPPCEQPGDPSGQLRDLERLAAVALASLKSEKAFATEPSHTGEIDDQQHMSPDIHSTNEDYEVPPIPSASLETEKLTNVTPPSPAKRNLDPSDLFGNFVDEFGDAAYEASIRGQPIKTTAGLLREEEKLAGSSQSAYDNKNYVGPELNEPIERTTGECKWVIDDWERRQFLRVDIARLGWLVGKCTGVTEENPSKVLNPTTHIPTWTWRSNGRHKGEDRLQRRGLPFPSSLNKKPREKQSILGHPRHLGNRYKEGDPLLYRLDPYASSLNTKPRENRRKVLRIQINGEDHLACPDSGSEMNIISKACAIEHGFRIRRKVKDRKRFEVGNGDIVWSIGRVLETVDLPGSPLWKKKRWFYVLEDCPVPVVMGMSFLREAEILTKYRHLLENCPVEMSDVSSLLWIGSPKNRLRCTLDGRQLEAVADTGSDINVMSLACAEREGFRIDRRPEARTKIAIGNGDVIETLGQVYVSNLTLDWREPEAEPPERAPRTPTTEITLEPDPNGSAYPPHGEGDDDLYTPFHVIENLPCDIIFGHKFLDDMDAFNKCPELLDIPPSTQNRQFDKHKEQYEFMILISDIWPFKKSSKGPKLPVDLRERHESKWHAERHRRSKNTVEKIALLPPHRQEAARRGEAKKLQEWRTAHANCQFSSS
ncbi:hypothetical protein V494_06388 [Pseudogymnoascus sp. VKM F-4513 (FW-928)]|nr:hypothetical protein V494_06388 [Pseudogymnoascus sp. VKM F-4513 (FW-928)]